MKQESAAAAAAVGLIGVGVGVAAGFAVVAWLGVVAGLAALLTAYLAYMMTDRMSKAEERTQRLEEQLRQMEGAIASQITARIQAEEDARRASLRAADAELGRTLSSHFFPDKQGPGHGLTDAETGLFGESYFLATVDARITAARRHLRPVAVGLLEIVVDPTADPRQAAAPSVVAECLLETLREADTACRLADGRFAIILEDTPENGAIWTIERLRRKTVAALDVSTLWAGVACYPAHGFDTEEILSQAEVALAAARDWPQDRIEIAEAR